MKTHRGVRYQISGGITRTRNVQVEVDGGLEDETVRNAIVEVLAATHQVGPHQVSLVSGPAVPKRRMPTEADIRDLKKSELLDLIANSATLKGISPDGTVKQLQDAIIERLGIGS